MLVAAVGVPGVGKTSVLRRVQEILKENGIKSDVVNFGDIMMEILKERFSVDREKMRKLPVEIQRRAQLEAAKRIKEIAENFDGITFVDTHIFIRTSEGYMSGLPSRVLEERGKELRAIVVITAEPKEIFRRRQKDTIEGRRPREEYAKESVEQIELHQNITLMGAVTASVMFGPLLIVVNNEEKKLEDAAREIADKLIRSFARPSRCGRLFYYWRYRL